MTVLNYLSLFIYIGLNDSSEFEFENHGLGEKYFSARFLDSNQSQTIRAMSAVTAASSLSSSEEDTRVHDTHTNTSNTPLTATQHPDLNYFESSDKDLHKTLSRTASRLTTVTQDPHGDFDYKTHLRHVLKKTNAEGIQTRELGFVLDSVTVQGDGSGIAYGETVGSLITGAVRIIQRIKLARRKVRKNILVDISMSLKPKEMLLVLGR